MRYMPSGSANQERAQLLELRVFGRRGILHIDLGEISEDVNGNGALDTEDSTRNGYNNNILDDDEDRGVDFKFDRTNRAMMLIAIPTPMGTIGIIPPTIPMIIVPLTELKETATWSRLIMADRTPKISISTRGLIKPIGIFLIRLTWPTLFIWSTAASIMGGALSAFRSRIPHHSTNWSAILPGPTFPTPFLD